jgi:hypothetical protein
MSEPALNDSFYSRNAPWDGRLCDEHPDLFERPCKGEDNASMGDAELQTGETKGLVRITNTGRRPVFISVIALTLSKGFEHTHLVLDESIGGKKLGESEKPLGIFVPYDGLAQYSKAWRKMRAYAEDSTGKRYYSKFPEKDAKTPPWVKA